MSRDFISDIADMHKKYGVHEAVETFDHEKLMSFLKFRFDFLKEELTEGTNAVEALTQSHNALQASKAADDVVDALIDLIVVAVGTLDAFKVNTELAWDRVQYANMQKEVGVKEGRPNPLGLPDLIKPEGWTAPVHADNLGRLTD